MDKELREKLDKAREIVLGDNFMPASETSAIFYKTGVDKLYWEIIKILKDKAE